MKLQDLINEVDLWLSEVPRMEKMLLSIISLVGSLSASSGDPAQRQKLKDMAAPAREQLGKLEEYKRQLENVLEELKAAKTQEEFRHIKSSKAEIQKEMEKTMDWAEKLEKFLLELSAKNEPAPPSRPRLR